MTKLTNFLVSMDILPKYSSEIDKLASFFPVGEIQYLFSLGLALQRQLGYLSKFNFVDYLFFGGMYDC